MYLGHGGVFFDPTEQVFKMFYLAGMRGGLAMAASKDLIHWTRPELGLAGGNLLLPAGPRWTGPELKTAGSDNCVWLDLHAKHSTERIKFLTCWRHVPGAQLPKGFRHSLHVSDGRTWSPGKPTGMAQRLLLVLLQPVPQRLGLQHQAGRPVAGDAGITAKAATFSKAPTGRSRFIGPTPTAWTNRNLPAVIRRGRADATLQPDAVAYESVMLGMHMILRGPRNEICDEGQYPKLSDLCLGFSRDGFHWHRPDRRPFIAASRKEGTWDRAYMHTTAGVCLVMDDKLWFPYTSFSGVSPDGTAGCITAAASAWPRCVATALLRWMPARSPRP